MKDYKLYFYARGALLLMTARYSISRWKLKRMARKIKRLLRENVELTLNSSGRWYDEKRREIMSLKIVFMYEEERLEAARMEYYKESMLQIMRIAKSCARRITKAK